MFTTSILLEMFKSLNVTLELLFSEVRSEDELCGPGVGPRFGPYSPVGAEDQRVNSPRLIDGHSRKHFLRKRRNLANLERVI